MSSPFQNISSLSFILNETEFSHSQNQPTLSITSNIFWTIDCDASWIHFSQKSGFESKSINFTVLKNNTNKERRTSIRLGTNEIIITQDFDETYFTFITTLELDLQDPINWPNGDRDQDGTPNAFEYYANLDLNDPSKRFVFKIKNSNAVDNEIILKLSKHSGKSEYIVEFSNDLENWNSYTSLSESSENEYRILRAKKVDLNANPMFYRVLPPEENN